MGDANLNVLWSRAIAEELVRGGVEHAVICPGSRSSPLALAFAAQEGLRCWSVIDERSAAFVALGIAKATGVPAAVVVTSGTAGAHFHPAIIEAAMSGVPLVAITADRPNELQGFGAPQTIPQAHLFGDFAVHFADLGVPEASTPVLLHLRATVARAVSRSMTQPRGAVHLNVPLREPLAPVPAPFGAESLSSLAREGRGGQPFTRFVSAQQTVDPHALQLLREQVATVERGVILCGPRDADDGLAEALLQLSRATGYPILAEATSQVRFGAGAEVVAHYDALLRHEGFATAHAPELVLRFGGGLTPKLLQRWIDGAAGQQVLFTEGGRVSDPAHAATQVLDGSPVEACLQLASGLERGPTAWTRAFADAEQLAAGVIAAALDDAAALSEPEVARVLARAMPQDSNLFVSSSMPIRALDAFAAPGNVRFRAHASRGVNGIDGILSTALGIAMARARPTVVLTGDVAFLHDVGGLLTAARERVSLTVLVVNNDGGGIFSFLPIAEVGSPAFEPFIATPHGVDLSHAAALYGARFHRPTHAAGLAQALAAGLEGGLHVIEVCLERSANVEVHRGLYRRVTDALEGGETMKLVFGRWGQGSRPVLLLHGFTGNRHAWSRVRPGLEPHVAALAVDLPGHGESPLPSGAGREGFVETLDALAELIEHEATGPIDVVGYSQGARIALALAVHHPQRVRRLVLESGSPGLHARKLRSERRAEDEVRAQAIESSGVEAFLDGWERLPLFAGLKRLPPVEQQALRERRAGQTAEGLAGALRTLGTGVQPDYWPSLPHLRCPTLLLTGSEDAKFTDIARAMAAEIPVVWRHALVDCGHAPHLEAPEVWCSEVLGFLSTPWYEAQVEVETASGSKS